MIGEDRPASGSAAARRAARSRHGMCRALVLAVFAGMAPIPVTPSLDAPAAERREEPDAIAAAKQACRLNQFAAFLRLYIQSPEVQERFTTPYVNTAPTGVRPDFISKSEFLEQFPLAVEGWTYRAANRPPLADRPNSVLLRTERLSASVMRVDWVIARFDVPMDDGRSIGVPVEIRDVPARILFTIGEDHCWRAIASILAPKDTPFPPGIQRLQCGLRGSNYGRELARVEKRLDRHPDDLDLALEIAQCMKLQGIVEKTIRDEPNLSRLSRDIENRLATLAKGQTPSARTALARDEQRFRRSLIRDQYVLADGTTGDWDLPGDLESRLQSRLDTLERTEPARADFAGEWRNISGTVEIRLREDGRFDVEANPVDIDFLAWTCAFEEVLRREKDTLSFTSPDGNRVRLMLRGGVLIVEQQDGSETCGAGGSLAGIYFPIRPA